MHELSLCQSIQGLVRGAAAGRPVATVHLRVGQLRQVVPETLTYCWTIVTDGTDLGGSVLEIDHVPITLMCRSCGNLTTVEHRLVLTCSACGGADVAVQTGEEFLVTTLDLVPTPADHTKEHHHG